ncbi:MAG: hypothetical protein GY793_08080 [Proteobacteria bacterium]|nr:hypothetical protein [Pseudomonadota bacterium]
MLKKELTDVRTVSRVVGYMSKEHPLEYYKKLRYGLSDKISAHVRYLMIEQEKDLLVYTQDPSVVNVELETDFEDEDVTENFEQQTETSAEDSAEQDITSENYFDAPELELLFNRVAFNSHHDAQISDDLKSLDDPVIIALDKIFSFELERLEVNNKSLIDHVSMTQKVGRVHSKIKEGRLQEASSLMSRFYNENKQKLLFGYLYLEILYAKAALGSQKSLSIARDVANTLCFLTDKSDEVLINYYRYIYVCREFVHDKEKALQLFRDFVLVDADKLGSNESLIQRDSFYMKCMILFLRFDPRGWNVFEIENMSKFVNESISGGIFYIFFIRDKILKLLDSVRYKHFVPVEVNLYNLYDSHSKIMHFIKSNYADNAVPKGGSLQMFTCAKKYVQNFLLSSKVPDFSEFLTNTSISGTRFLEHTTNDKYLQNLGMFDNGFWRSWICKITFETSLQNPGILPLELVVREAKLLTKYEALANKAHTFEKEILADEKYAEVKDFLGNVRADAIMAVTFGENKYNPLTYGLSVDSMKSYYETLKAINNVANNLVSGLIVERGNVGLFWNLEEIQLMLESLNLTIDNKQVGIKARLDMLLNSKQESLESDEYMGFTEHLSLYWWVYALLVSLMIIIFNMVF